MKIPEPIIKDGKTYDNYSVNLSISTVVMPTGINVNANLSLTPYSNDFEELRDYRKSLCLSDLFKSPDADIQKCAAAIDVAIQELINAKKI